MLTLIKQFLDLLTFYQTFTQVLINLIIHVYVLYILFYMYVNGKY